MPCELWHAGLVCNATEYGQTCASEGVTAHAERVYDEKGFAMKDVRLTHWSQDARYFCV